MESQTKNKILFVSIFIIIGICFAVAAAAFLASRSAPARTKTSGGTPPPINTLSPDSLYLGTFRAVQGTSYLVAEVNEEYRSKSSYGSSRWFDYNPGAGGSMRNLVFMDGDSLDSRRLFDSNDYVITAVSQFPQPNLNEAQIQAIVQAGEKAGENIITVSCMLFQYVEKDTDMDGYLTTEDELTVGITDSGGHGYTDLFTGVERVYWTEMTGPKNLVIVYAQEGQRKVSMIDTTTRAVTQTKVLVELGEEVK